MKKYPHILAAFVLMTMLAFTGCGGSEKDNAESTPPPVVESSAPAPNVKQATVQEYFPFFDNALYRYEGIGSDDLNQQSYLLYHSDNKVQRLSSNKFHQVTDVIHVADGELRAIFGDSYYYFDNLLDTNDIMNTTVLKEPLEVGARWNYDELTVSEITAMDASVETPAGVYNNAMEITSVNETSGLVQTDYYAKNVGLVKTVYQQNDAEISMVLKEIVENTGMDIQVDFFGANSTTGQQVVEQRTLTVTTNMDIADYFNEQLKIAPGSDFEPLLPSGAKINSIETSWKYVAVNIDLSKNFVQEMSVGAGIENMVLQCLANTVGNFYGVKNVQITLDGNPYESGHIMKDIGEYWTVEPVPYEE